MGKGSNRGAGIESPGGSAEKVGTEGMVNQSLNLWKPKGHTASSIIQGLREQQTIDLSSDVIAHLTQGVWIK